jgi:hypothetical protein
MSETEALEERVMELEAAANKLMLIINNDDSPFYNDEVLKSNLVKTLKDRAAAAKRIQQLRSNNDRN